MSLNERRKNVFASSWGRCVGLVRPERAARRRLVGKVSLRISWSISLSRSERERAITKQIQGDETHSPKRGILPAAAFVREQPAVGAMHKNDRAKHFDRQRQRYPRDIDPENECDSAEQLECDSAVGDNRW